MKCPECTSSNRKGANFCDNCGCNLRLTEKQKIDSRYSFPPSEEKVSVDNITLDGERKHATVLFSDLSGYTEMSERLDPEEVKEITTLIFADITEVIAKYNGLVSKYIGDAVMAVFGARKAREDDPISAIKAATEIHKLVESYNTTYESKIGHTLSMHSGINSGLVVTSETKLEKGFHGFVGDTINLASRLSSLANVNEILIGPETFLQTKGYFDFEALPPTIIKGKAQPISVYRLIAQKKQPIEARGIEGIKTRIIGRDAELQYLQTAFYKTMGDQVSRVVTIVGEAGIGKSRLLNEFKKSLESLPYDPLVLRGRGTPDNLGSTNGLWKNLFTLQFGIEARDKPPLVIEKFRQNMAEILTPNEADLVGHFVGFDFSSSRAVMNLLGSQAFEAMALTNLASYLRSLAKSETIILLDDIHFADEGSINILERIVGSIPHAPLMIVCMTRPILYEQRPQWGTGIDVHQVLNLGPLSKQPSKKLIQEILGKALQIPDKLESLILDTAEGNPFYIEEFVKMLIEDGVIVISDEPWQIRVEKLKDLKIPTTLNGLLQARLDAIPEKQKRLIQRASVIGRLFWDQGLMYMTADDKDRLSWDELQVFLGNAVERGLILKRERSNIADSQEFVFKHALLKDVAYETLLFKHRRLYHRLAAEWLLEKAGERIDEYLHIIGSHYELAGDNLKAVKYLNRAGDEFYKINAYQKAISVLEHSLELLTEEDQNQQAEIQVKLGEIYTDKGEYSRARTHFDRALVVEELLNSGNLITVLYRSGWISSKMGQYEKALGYVDRGLEIARDHHDTSGIAQCLHTKGWIYFLVGAFDEAMLNAQEALKFSREMSDKRSMSLCLNVIQATASGLGTYEEALGINEECIAIGRELGDQLIISRGLCNQGEHYRKQHKYQEAIRCYKESLEVSREIDQKNLICITINNLGFALNQLESSEDAEKCCRESLSLALEIEAHALALHTVVVIAEISALRRQLVKSAELIGMVCAHPMFTHEHAYETERVVALLRKNMSESDIQAALKRGKKQEVEAVYKNILLGAIPGDRITQQPGSGRVAQGKFTPRPSQSRA